VVITANEEFLSPEEVGDRLGVSVYTVRRWVKAGQLRAFKPGKEYRVRESDLEEFLAAREVRPKVEAPPEEGQRSFNDLLEERRLSRFAGAIVATAHRWGEAMADADTDDDKRYGLIDAALELGAVISERAEAEDWDALPNPERLEIVTTMEQLTEAARRGIAHLEASHEAKTQEEQIEQRREQIREMTRRISA
jgi:excisionase family DNA binding protein